MPIPKPRRKRKGIIRRGAKPDRGMPFTSVPTAEQAPPPKGSKAVKKEKSDLSWDEIPSSGKRPETGVSLPIRAASIALLIVLGMLGLTFLAPKMRQKMGDNLEPRLMDPKLELLTHDAVVDYFTKYYGSPSWQARAVMVRDSDRVRPIMEAYYREHPLEQFDLNALTSYGLLENLEQEFGYAVFSQTNDLLPVKSVFSIEADGRFLLDWEATLPYSEASIADLIAAESTEEVTLRVKLVRSDYYNYSYSDSEEFVSFAIRQKDSNEVAFAYLRRDHPDYSALQSFLVKKGDSPVHHARINPTIRVVKEPGNQSNQLEIVDILSHYWLVVDPAP